MGGGSAKRLKSREIITTESVILFHSIMDIIFPWYAHCYTNCGILGYQKGKRYCPNIFIDTYGFGAVVSKDCLCSGRRQA
jgi:hypothetical protein